MSCTTDPTICRFLPFTSQFPVESFLQNWFKVPSAQFRSLRADTPPNQTSSLFLLLQSPFVVFSSIPITSIHNTTAPFYTKQSFLQISHYLYIFSNTPMSIPWQKMIFEKEWNLMALIRHCLFPFFFQFPFHFHVGFHFEQSCEGSSLSLLCMIFRNPIKYTSCTNIVKGGIPKIIFCHGIDIGVLEKI